MWTTRAVSMRIGLIAGLFTSVTGMALAQSYFRGVNVSQAEWGDPFNAFYGPGNYAYATAPTFNYFAARGLPFIRLIVKWERLQPALDGALDATQMQYLKQDIAYAQAAGAVVSICPHNEARYATLESQMANFDSDACIIDNPCPGSPVNVTRENFVNFWVAMSNEFMNDPTVVAYDLTNEPHDMGVANWAQIAQAAVTAIRANGDRKTIMVEGDGWSGAQYWAYYNGSAPFITDPANNYYYEAHQYFDSDGSGTYAESYATELAANSSLPTIGVTRLQPFIDWCTTNKVPCYLGEYGIPSNDPGWLTVLNNFLNALDQAGLPGTYWAAGELWAAATGPGCTSCYNSVQPANNFTVDNEQLPTLLGHLAPGLLRSASAAASYGWASAPGELVAGYGSGLGTTVMGATSLPLQTSLGGVQVQLTDSSGTVSFAPLLYVSPGQINYQIPSGVAPGLVNVEVWNGTTAVSSGVLEVGAVAPGIFTANSTGQGVAAAQIQRFHPDGTYEYDDVFTYDPGSAQFVPAPIAFNGDSLYLLLYGTGFDAATGSGTTVTVGTAPLSVQYAGWPQQFAGEDQIVAPLPTSLAGAGTVVVNVTVNGSTANPVTIAFQ